MRPSYIRNGHKPRHVVAESGNIDSHGIESVSKSSQYRLLIPLLEGTNDEANKRLLRVGATMARNRNGELLIACIVRVPEQTPYGAFSNDKLLMRDVRDRTEGLVEQAQELVSAQGTICLTHREAQAILNVIEQHNCQGTLLEVSSDHSQRWRLLSGATVEKVVARAPSDVFVLKYLEENKQPKRFLLAVSGGPHSGLAVETACVLARDTNATIDIVHVLTEDTTDSQQTEAQRVLDAATRIMDDVDVATKLIIGESVASEIIGRSDEYDMTILGAPTKGLLKQFIFGTVSDSVTRGVEQPVLMTKQGSESNQSVFYRWLLDETSIETIG